MDAPAPRPRRKRRSVRVDVGAQQIFKMGLSRFDLSDPYYFAVSLNWRDFGLLFLAAEGTINTIFALLYLAVPGCIANARAGAFTDAFFFSLETLATVGYGVMAPATLYGHMISALEILTGVIFTAIMTGLLFVRFSKPKPKIVYAEKLVVTQHNGRPTLMLRIGNARSSLLTNAAVSIHVLSRQVSIEGLKQRAIIELPLLRQRLPVFAILWTLMHVIDEDSPLHGLDAADVEMQDLRLFVTVSARDQMMGQEVSDLRNYAGADILFAHRYADAIKTLEDGSTIANYAKISAVLVDG